MFFGFKLSAPKELLKLWFSIKADRDKAATSISSVSPTTPTSPKDTKVEALLIVIPEIPAEMFMLLRRTMREGRSSGELRVEKEVRGFDEGEISMEGGWKLSSTPAVPRFPEACGA
jgi:hypothetical protein